MTYKFTDIFTCDLVAHAHFRVGGVDAGGEKRKPNTLPLSMECINIKFDSLASFFVALCISLQISLITVRVRRTTDFKLK